MIYIVHRGSAIKMLWKNLHDNKRRFAAALIIGLIYHGICVIVPTLSGKLINSFIGGQSSSTHFLFIYLAFSALQIIFFLLDQKASTHFEIRQKQIMRKNVFQSVSGKDCETKKKTAAYISFVNNDIPVAASQFFLGTIDMIKCAALIGFSALSLMNVHFILGLVVILLSVMIVCVPNFIRKKSGEARTTYSEKMAAYNAHLQSYLGGLRVIALFRYHGRANRLMEERNGAAASAEIELAKHQRFVQGVTAFLQTSKTVLILAIGALLIARKEMNAGDLIVVLELDGVIGAPIEYLSYIIHSKNEAFPLVKEYAKIVECQKISGGAVTVDNIASLELDNVKFHAGEVDILKDISVKFEKGKKYIITGPSGSGKSTLLNLIAGMEDAASGSILVNGVHISSLSKNAYWDKLCLVLQEPYLFETTLKENILLGRDIPQEKYTQVLERMKLTYLLDRYADSTISPELADTLSGGEKQRVCLARAMVGAPDFYLLDEITSALDKDTAQTIEAEILSEEATVVHVCHKPTPQLYSRYDVHYRMEEGRLQETRET